MAGDALRGFLQLGFFVGGCGFLMLFIQPPQSPEFVLSLCSTAMGFVIVAAVVVLQKYVFSKLPPDLEDIDDDDGSMR